MVKLKRDQRIKAEIILILANDNDFESLRDPNLTIISKEKGWVLQKEILNNDCPFKPEFINIPKEGECKVGDIEKEIQRFHRYANKKAYLYFDSRFIEHRHKQPKSKPLICERKTEKGKILSRVSGYRLKRDLKTLKNLILYFKYLGCEYESKFKQSYYFHEIINEKIESKVYGRFLDIFPQSKNNSRGPFLIYYEYIKSRNKPLVKKLIPKSLKELAKKRNINIEVLIKNYNKKLSKIPTEKEMISKRLAAEFPNLFDLFLLHESKAKKCIEKAFEATKREYFKFDKINTKNIVFPLVSSTFLKKVETQASFEISYIVMKKDYHNLTSKGKLIFENGTMGPNGDFIFEGDPGYNLAISTSGTSKAERVADEVFQRRSGITPKRLSAATRI